MYEDILKVKLPFLFLLQVFVEKKHQMQDIHVCLAYGRERLENIRGKCEELRKYLDSSFGLENIVGEGRTAEDAPRAR